MQKTEFQIDKMDCAVEEQLIRMKLADVPYVLQLRFNLENRRLLVYHQGVPEQVEALLDDLNLGQKILNSQRFEGDVGSQPERQRRLLWMVLGINLLFFVVEMLTGLIADSMGLVADSLDMLADASVYGLSLFAVGRSVRLKKRVARTAAYLQMALAVLGFLEVLRRLIGLSAFPDFRTMIVVSTLALMANAMCLYLLRRSESQDAHMRASTIFTSNDVVINLGVIAAALGVAWLNSSIPDLVVGGVVLAVVIYGAVRIWKVSR